MSFQVIACFILSFVVGFCVGVLCICVAHNRRNDLEEDDLGYLEKIFEDEMSDKNEMCS